jgi:hypothetical protein
LVLLTAAPVQASSATFSMSAEVTRNGAADFF